jgi:hypothetical protein
MNSFARRETAILACARNIGAVGLGGRQCGNPRVFHNRPSFSQYAKAVGAQEQQVGYFLHVAACGA